MKSGHILVIDDDPVMRELLPLLLSAEGYTAIASDSETAALATLAHTAAEAQPSIVLTDLNLHGVRRPDLAAVLRSALPDATRLIAMSASDPTAEEHMAFDAFLRKPFTLHEFGHALQRAEAKLRSGLRSLRTDSTGPGKDKAQPVLDMAIYGKLHAIIGAEQLGTMYTMLSEDAEQRLERMRLAADDANEVTFSQEAHAIKGACGMLGASSLHSLASRMEQHGLSCATLLPELANGLVQLRRMLESTLTEPLVNASRARP